MDTDATAYIEAVETADAASLAAHIKAAINDFVIGCKTDGIWPNISAACFLAGPATFAGALVPLIGSAPTSNGFIDSDYSQAQGLLGDADSYIDSNRDNNADPQDDQHLSVWVSAAGVAAGAVIGVGINQTGSTHISLNVPLDRTDIRNRSNGFDQFNSTASTNGFKGISRSLNASYEYRANNVTQSKIRESQSPYSGNVFVFARNNYGSANLPSDARLAWYSIGKSLDLALLDTRLATYMTALDAGPTGNPTGNLNSSLHTVRHAL